MKKSKYKWNGIPVVAIVTGSICGGLEAGATWPNEVIKTELQTQRDGKYKGVIDCATRKLRSQGIISLYRGLVPIVIGSMPKAGIRFGAYSTISGYLQDENGKMGTLQSMQAGVGAGTMEAIFAVTPMETLKTRLINKNVPFVSGTANILRKEGLRGIYKGLAPTIAKQSINQATRFAVYNKYVGAVKAHLGVDELNPGYALLGGMTAGAVSAVVNQPVDTIKTRMQGVAASQYKGTVDCIVQTVQTEGFLALYKGLIPRLGRLVPGQGIVFSVYNSVSPRVERLFTGGGDGE